MVETRAWLQLGQLEVPTVLVLNMQDEAEEHGIRLDLAGLEATLGIPVRATVATRGACALVAALLMAHGLRRLYSPREATSGQSITKVEVVLQGYASGMLSMFDVTSNDLVAATPLIWAYALALRPVSRLAASLAWPAASGVLAGLSVLLRAFA